MLARLGGTSCRVLRCSGITEVARLHRLVAPRQRRHLAAADAAAANTQQQQVAAPHLANMAVDSPRAADHGQQQKKQRKQPDGGARRPALWWKDRPSYRCPACGQQCFKVPNFEAHILRCCPDVAPAEEWHAMLQAAAVQQTETEHAQQQDGEQETGEQQVQQAQQQQQQQQAMPSGETSARAPPQWKVHPADAAIRAWLEQAEQREAQQRRRAVSAHAVPAAPTARAACCCPCGWPMVC